MVKSIRKSGGHHAGGDEVSITDRVRILNLDSYAVYRLAANPFGFTSIVNVPTDGWCLLYSVQLAMLVDHGRHIDLLGMRIALLNEFESRVCNDQSGFRNFLCAFEPSDNRTDNYRGRRQSKLLYDDPKPLVSSHTDELASNVEINKFMLLRYVDQRIFNSAIVDLAPHLLSSALGFTLRVYELSDHEIRHVDELQFIDDSSLSSLTPVVNVLYVKENLHFVPLLTAPLSHPLDHDALAKLVADNSSSFAAVRLAEQVMLGNEFYSQVARNFHKSQDNDILNLFPDIEIYNRSSERLKRLDWLDPDQIKSLEMHSVPTTTLLAASFLASHIELVDPELSRRFTQRFPLSPTNIHLEHYLNSCTLADWSRRGEHAHFQRLLDSLRTFDALNLRLLVHSTTVTHVLLDLMRLASPHGLYARLNLIIASRCRDDNSNSKNPKFVGYFLSIPPYGVLVDQECLDWCVLLTLTVPSSPLQSPNQPVNLLSLSEYLFKSILTNKGTGRTSSLDLIGKEETRKPTTGRKKIMSVEDSTDLWMCLISGAILLLVLAFFWLVFFLIK